MKKKFVNFQNERKNFLEKNQSEIFKCILNCDVNWNHVSFNSWIRLFRVDSTIELIFFNVSYIIRRNSPSVENEKEMCLWRNEKNRRTVFECYPKLPEIAFHLYSLIKSCWIRLFSGNRFDDSMIEIKFSTSCKNREISTICREKSKVESALNRQRSRFIYIHSYSFILDLYSFIFDWILLWIKLFRPDSTIKFFNVIRYLEEEEFECF